MNTPAYRGINVTTNELADNKDIRDLLEKLVPEASAQMKNYAKQFAGKDEKETAKKIFDFLKNDLKYVADGEQQIIKLPSALMRKKVGDCKSFSLLTASILENLNIPYTFVYASYNSNPIPAHVYVQTKSGIIIDAVYGIFNKEKKANYKYKSNMKVGYMAGIGGCGCGGKCGCNKGMGNVWDDLQEKKRQAQRYLREKEEQAERFAKEQRDKAIAEAKALRDKAEAEAKRLRDKAEAEAKALRDKAIDTAKDARDSILAKGSQLQSFISDEAKQLFQGAKTIGLSGGRALFMVMLELNLDGFATKLASGDTSALLAEWYKLGGDRTKLAEALKRGASKPEKKIGFLPALKKIYKRGGISGVDEGSASVTPTNTGFPTTTTPVDYDKAKAEATKALQDFALSGDTKALIMTLSATTGGVIGALIGAGGGPLAVASGAIGTGAGGALGTIIIQLTKVIRKAVDKTPDTDIPIMPIKPPSEPTKGKDNTMLYVGGALLVGAGIYFATKKK